jgi:hypothetical protein
VAARHRPFPLPDPNKIWRGPFGSALLRLAAQRHGRNEQGELKPGKKPGTQDFAARACWMLPRRMGVPSVTARTTGSLSMGARRANGQRSPTTHGAALLKVSFKIVHPAGIKRHSNVTPAASGQPNHSVSLRCRENLSLADEQRRTTTPN